MKTSKKLLIHPGFETELSSAPVFDRTRTLRYVGSVTRAMNERILSSIGKLVDIEPHTPISMLVTSTGGPTGNAMSFYDTVRHIIKPKLTTVGSGDVDSSGIIIFLSGDVRYVTARTTLLLHPAGRIFGNQRYTVHEMEAMLAEDKLKDEQYASVVAENSNGILSTADVLKMMERHTILSPADLVSYGLAHEILP